MERTFHLPREPGSAGAETFGRASLAVAELAPGELGAMLVELRAQARPGRSGLAERARAIAEAAGRLADPAGSLHARALAVLPATTGFSAAMIAERLPHVLGALSSEALVRIVSSATSPVARLVGVVSAGNVPGVALAKTALALAAGSACFVKTAAGEPMLTVLFAEALGEVSPALARALAVAWWRGGEERIEEALLANVDTLVAYGSDAALAALAARSPRPIVAHGHKLSVAVVRPGAGDPSALAAAAARDVAAYDQLGCLSPQAIFTVGASDAARASFVAALGAALGELDDALPIGLVPESAALAIHRVRDEAEWRAIRGEAVSLAGAAGRWTLIDDPTPGFAPSPLHRTIVVRRIEALADLGRALGPWWPRVESIGIGPWPDAEAAAMLSRSGIPRVVALGTMQSPGLGWRQGGLDPMAGIVYEPGGSPASGQKEE